MKKILLITLGLFAIIIVFFILMGSYFSSQYEQPLNQKAYYEKFDKFSRLILDNRDSLKVTQSIDSLDVFIKTYDTIGYSDTQKEQFIFVSEKLQNKQGWKDNLMVERRLRNAEYIDGSNLSLVEAVKSRLNNPNSFEHVQTSMYTNKDMKWIAIDMKFRAKNAFNAKITRTATCQLTFNDEVKSLKIN